LILGYNGLGRITGNENGSVVAAAAGAVSRWGATGWNRLFNTDFGGQVSWLIPAALILFAAAIVYTIAAPRTDIRRAAIILFGGWLLITGSVISLAQGIIHPYYTIALAPPIGALAGAGGWMLWQRRTHPLSRAVMALALVATAGSAEALLVPCPSWEPALRPALLRRQFRRWRPAPRRRGVPDCKRGRFPAEGFAAGKRAWLRMGCGHNRRQLGRRVSARHR